MKNLDAWRARAERSLEIRAACQESCYWVQGAWFRENVGHGAESYEELIQALWEALFFSRKCPSWAVWAYARTHFSWLGSMYSDERMYLMSLWRMFVRPDIKWFPPEIDRIVETYLRGGFANKSEAEAEYDRVRDAVECGDIDGLSWHPDVMLIMFGYSRANVNTISGLFYDCGPKSRKIFKYLPSPPKGFFGES